MLIRIQPHPISTHEFKQQVKQPDGIIKSIKPNCAASALGHILYVTWSFPECSRREKCCFVSASQFWSGDWQARLWTTDTVAGTQFHRSWDLSWFQPCLAMYGWKVSTQRCFLVLDCSSARKFWDFLRWCGFVIHAASSQWEQWHNDMF